MKAILVVDMPKTCAECACHLWQVCVPADEDIDEYIDPNKTKPNWCPLRPLPHKLQADWYTDGYKEGFNACLDAITGETE